jgi:IS5 family transposase
VIGDLKDDCWMRRCRLTGTEGDALHAITCAAGYNLRWLMRWIALFCALIRAAFVLSTRMQRPMQIAIPC